MNNLRKSRFTVAVPVPDGGGELLAIYQTMTDALILMPGGQWSSIARGGEGAADPETVETLYKQGFLTRADVDEGYLFQNWFQQYANDFTSLKSKVLVTRKCNNRCRYCIVDAETGEMSPETARAVDRFYLALIKEKNPRDVEDEYSGGEVLLNQRVVIESASRRFHFCQGRGIDYGFSIISNGTLLSPSIVANMKEVGLKAIRVSVAGPEDIHDKLRPSRSGGKTYRTIMRNLESVSGEIPIGIECQYDSGSSDYKRVPELIDDILARGVAVESITFTPIFRNRSGSPFEAGTGDPSILLFLMKEAGKRGFPQFGSPPRNGCLSDYRSRITFDTDGSLIPCASFQSGEMVYGDVREGIDFVSHAQVLRRNFPEKCLDHCELLPLCRGGCRLLSFMRDGKFNGVDCQYEVMMLVLEETIRTQAVAGLVPAEKAGGVGSEAAA